MSIWDTMAAQYGAATVGQFNAAGIPVSTVSQWVKDGFLVRLQRGVVGLAGDPPTLERKCWAALKACPTAALSHRTATYFWELYAEEPPVEIVVKRNRSPELRDVVVHRTRDDFERHKRNGLWVTSPMRSVLDLGAVEPQAVRLAVEKGRVANLFTVAALEWQLAEVARNGRRGAGPLRAVLDEWALGSKRPDGVLEPRFARLAASHGLPRPVFQHRVGEYRLDFAYPELKIAIEVDGYAFHSGLDAYQRDRDRQNHLVAHGWTVLRFTWADVVRRPGYVAQLIAAAIGNSSAEISA
jgi:hypothetical protein